jgi:hypothetical protein
MGTNNSNRVPHGNGIPIFNANEGDSIKPRMLNRLAEGIDRSTLQFGPGVKVSRTGNSTCVSISKKVSQPHPFEAFEVGASEGKMISFSLGCFFGQFNQFPNVWKSNNSVSWAGVSDYTQGTSKEEGYHATGGEIMIDVENANYLSSQHINSEGILIMPLKEGLYYIEIGAWSGKQLEGDLGGTSAAEWNQYSLSMKGMVRPIIKYASRTDMVKLSGQKDVIPICTVDKYFRIFQALSSDIFWPSKRSYPFQVYITEQDGNEARIIVTPGCVNRVIPKLDNVYLDADEVPDQLVLGESYVTIKVTYEENKNFPRTAEVYLHLGGDLNALEDTPEYSYYPIAKINETSEGGNKTYTVRQLSAGHLVCNRTKAGAGEATWWWHETGA